MFLASRCCRTGSHPREIESVLTGWPGRSTGCESLQGTEIVLNELNRVETLDYETMEALSGEAAIPYVRGWR